MTTVTPKNKLNYKSGSSSEEEDGKPDIGKEKKMNANLD